LRTRALHNKRPAQPTGTECALIAHGGFLKAAYVAGALTLGFIRRTLQSIVRWYPTSPRRPFATCGKNMLIVEPFQAKRPERVFFADNIYVVAHANFNSIGGIRFRGGVLAGFLLHRLWLLPARSTRHSRSRPGKAARLWNGSNPLKGLFNSVTRQSSELMVTMAGTKILPGVRRAKWVRQLLGDHHAEGMKRLTFPCHREERA